MSSNQMLSGKPNSLHKAGGKNPFEACELLADQVLELMVEKDPRAGDCLQFVADTYNYTKHHIVRLAIENCFLYRLGNGIFNDPEHRSLIKMLPEPLHTLLLQQMTEGTP